MRWWPRSSARCEPPPLRGRRQGGRAVFIVGCGAESPATGTSTHLVRALVRLRIDCSEDASDSSALDPPALHLPALHPATLDRCAIECAVSGWAAGAKAGERGERRRSVCPPRSTSENRR